MPSRSRLVSIARGLLLGAQIWWFVGSAAGAAAEGNPTVVRRLEPAAVHADELKTTFAESLDFRLEARPANRVTGAILRYRVGDDAAIQRRQPTVAQTSDRAVLELHETVARGQIAPASEIRWWWTLTLADGTSAVTTPRTVRYLDQHFDWRSTTTDDISVWTYGPDDDLAPRVAKAAAAGLDRAAELTGDHPDRAINIVTYRTRPDMLPALVARGEAYEQRLATLGARVASDIVILLAEKGYRDIDAVLAHELSHTVLHLGFEEAYLNAPLWLDEGLAMYSEGDLSTSDRRILDDAIRSNELMSLRSLTSFPGRAELVPLAYAESQDIVSFLLTRDGLVVFRSFLDDLGSGQMTVDEALTAHYTIDQLGLYQEYRAARALPPAQPAKPEPAGSASRDDSTGLECLAGAIALPALLLLPAFRRSLFVAV